MCVWIFPVRNAGLISINFWILDCYCGEALENWEGYIKIEQDDWSQLSDEEKIERDWKRYAEEMINRNEQKGEFYNENTYGVYIS